MATLAAALATVAAGCSVPVPFAMAETAETLGAGEVSAGVVGGGGGAGGSSAERAGGAFGRIRVGVGHGQEVGVEGGGYFFGVPGNGSMYGTGALRYKLALSPHAALLTAFGLSWIEKQVNAGGDFGFVLSSRPLGGVARLYVGARATLMAPTSGPLEAGGVAGGGILPLGVDYEPEPGWHVAFEAGLVGGGDVHHDFFGNDVIVYDRWIGGYGAVALSRAWTRRR